MKRFSWSQFQLLKSGLAAYLILVGGHIFGIPVMRSLFQEFHAFENIFEDHPRYIHIPFSTNFYTGLFFILLGTCLIVKYYERVAAILALVLCIAMNYGMSQLLQFNVIALLLVIYICATPLTPYPLNVRLEGNQVFEWELNKKYIWIAIPVALILVLKGYYPAYIKLFHLMRSVFIEGHSLFQLDEMVKIFFESILAGIVPFGMFHATIFYNRRNLSLSILVVVSVAFSILLGFDPAVLLFYFIWPWKQELTPPVEWVFYDGSCGLCHKVCRFLILEDPTGKAFFYAPLGGEYFQTLVPDDFKKELPDSIVVKTGQQKVLLKADAALHIGERLGGPWGFFAMILKRLPRHWLVNSYDFVARHRHKYFTRPQQSCPILPADLRERFHP